MQAQPNRKTGVCETDVFLMKGGTFQDIKLCGINSGQHRKFIFSRW